MNFTINELYNPNAEEKKATSNVVK
jgi:hypothetical protein